MNNDLGHDRCSNPARPHDDEEEEMTALPPSGAGKFARAFPKLWSAYEALGTAVSESGPVDARTRRLVKLALAIGAGSEGAVHSHVRQAREEGLGTDELRQVANLAITTLGFPAAMAGLSWINDVVEGDEKGGGR
jgi:alkylhydroperoxidase/carboxymuconolactone decarboxylase family protein YurZ